MVSIRDLRVGQKIEWAMYPDGKTRVAKIISINKPAENKLIAALYPIEINGFIAGEFKQPGRIAVDEIVSIIRS